MRAFGLSLVFAALVVHSGCPVVSPDDDDVSHDDDDDTSDDDYTPPHRP